MRTPTRLPVCQLATVLALWLAVTSCLGAVHYVTSTADSGPGTLRYWVDNAQNGDVIKFAVTGQITLTSGTLLVDNWLTIAGPGANKLTVTRSFISGTPQFPIFTVPYGLRHADISGLTIRNGTRALVVEGNGWYASSAQLSRCVITRNQTADNGGGILNEGALTLRNCTISNNTAGGSGGGISSTYGLLKLVKCTISGNTAGRNGGGIAHFAGPLELRHCTISENRALNEAEEGGGGGIFNYTPPPPQEAAEARLFSTLVAYNITGESGPDLRGEFVSLGYNLVRLADGSTGFTNGYNHDIVGHPFFPVGLDPDGLKNNGGPTPTIALLASSPAVDAGAHVNDPLDQRDFGFAGRRDIGAFELGGQSAVKITSVKRAPNGTVTLTGRGIFGEEHTLESSFTPEAGGFHVIGTFTVPANETSPSGAWEYTDPGPAPTELFYRVTFP
ncbi:MAG TPA: right-handed parallel beta-helix repeat-containing protein [Chthoniobacterales bacterium]|nr:right-handed parallel beta-helix repeat-containing protein [Chthoniobacterales bacterium]